MPQGFTGNQDYAEQLKGRLSSVVSGIDVQNSYDSQIAAQTQANKDKAAAAAETKKQQNADLAWQKAQQQQVNDLTKSQQTASAHQNAQLQKLLSKMQAQMKAQEKKQQTALKKAQQAQQASLKSANSSGGGGGGSYEVIKGSANFEKFLKAEVSQESGGNYSVVNRSSGALGKYQIMPGNIPSWTKAALGHSISSQEFLHNPSAQDATARHMLLQYYNKWGAAGAAVAWYAGPGTAAKYVRNPSAYNRRQGNYPSINSYALSILRKMRQM